MMALRGAWSSGAGAHLSALCAEVSSIASSLQHRPHTSAVAPAAFPAPIRLEWGTPGLGAEAAAPLSSPVKGAPANMTEQADLCLLMSELFARQQGRSLTLLGVLKGHLPSLSSAGGLSRP